MSQSSSLGDRYGTSKSATRGGRIALWILGGVTLVALALWLLWANPLRIGPSAQEQDLGHTVIDSSTVAVDFSVTVTPGHAFACAVKAVGAGFGVVGWKVFTYPASDTLTQTMSEVVKTTEPATTGFVSSCWLT